MKVFEVQKEYDNPDIEYALMTLDEFVNHRNPDGKYHSSDSYDFSLKKMNTDHSLRKFTIRLSSLKEWDIAQNDNGLIIYENDKLYAIYDGSTLYYSNIIKSDFPFQYSDRTFNRELSIRPTQYKRVKYLDEYISKVQDVVKRNLTEYPVVLNRFIINDEQYVIRAEQVPEKNKGHTIVILNNQGYVVAQASNEWGATLLTVAQEYRNKGLGKKIANVWYKYNPDYLSGGFTQAGLQNAKKFYFSRVREAIQSGWYKDWIKDGTISKDKVKEIISSLPAKYKKSDVSKQEDKPQPLFYSDYQSTIIIYDKKFYDNPDYQYLYGVVHFEEKDGKLFPYRIDYDRKFDKLTTYAMLQMAKDLGYNINLDMEPADMVEYENMEDVEFDGQVIKLSSDKLPLRELVKFEKRFRNSKDQYDETYYQIMDMAFQKWN